MDLMYCSTRDLGSVQWRVRDCTTKYSPALSRLMVPLLRVPPATDHGTRMRAEVFGDAQEYGTLAVKSCMPTMS